MSDFLVAFLVLVALASIGSFASAPDTLSFQCAGNWLQLCW
jgi:hypothetical protein